MSFAARQQTTSGSSTVLACSHGNSPYVSAYGFTQGVGFGSKFANPTVLPTNTGRGLAFNPSNTALAVAHDSSPYISVYSFSAGGFGAKYSDPATLPAGNAYSVSFTASGNDIAVAHLSSPYVSVYPWSSSTGFGAKYSNPATLPPGDATSVAFSPNNSNIAVASSTSSYQAVYPWTPGTGFGTKYSNPAPALPNVANTVVFSSGSYPNQGILFGHQSSPFISAYNFTSGTGFGSKFADPSTLPPTSCTNLFYGPDNQVFVTTQASPYLIIYGSFTIPTGLAGASYQAGPSTPWNGATPLSANAVAARKYGLYNIDVAIGIVTFPATTNLHVFKYSTFTSTWVSQYANPSVLPSGSCTGVAWANY